MILLVLTSCNIEDCYYCFGATTCLHLLPWKWRQQDVPKTGNDLQYYTVSQSRKS